MNEFNFISSNCTDRDIKLFFDDEKCIRIKDEWNMANIVVEIGIFKSINQAKKNNWGFKIPVGFNHFEIGKNKKQVWILNIKDDD